MALKGDPKAKSGKGALPFPPLPLQVAALSIGALCHIAHYIGTSAGKLKGRPQLPILERF